ncbi:hypothetical protein BCU70_16600 [Vibrio sp. 10N.286.49.C2]|uniref:GNAT family N-acetyltransferase n=1 Tax=unclassified Vibrio TaxID=2614977 RepID=UPI000C832029|nr:MULTISPECIES: GNAT family N-acetyltransferase [unclassified Vibrio]PMH37254.1 hypothetical protein BCU70_16600 [Vibrio sp. 10N.286.49.C2]PMH57399.1 hypothetical protein BCU66_05240 [Vibrio sp. 10N.286.49.B1]PMH82158.1 hypothetical protein BCU58_19120 [Vibrio sp. 10N.286.48.B7]
MSIKFESRHLKMRQINVSDEDFFKQLHKNPHVTRLCFDTPSDQEIEQRFQSRLPPWCCASHHWLCLTIVDKSTKQKIGITGIIINEGKAEVGYLLAPEHQGKGFATESLEALLLWAQLSWEKQSLRPLYFSAVVTEGNKASERVLTKCGFTFIEQIANAYVIDGVLYDDRIFER